MNNVTDRKHDSQIGGNTPTGRSASTSNDSVTASNSVASFGACQTIKQRCTPDLGSVTTSQIADNLPDETELQSMYGVKSSTAARGLLMSALQGLGEGGAHYRSFVLSMGAELEPNDAIEAMLVTQMAVTHAAMMTSVGSSLNAKSDQARESYDRITNRLGRTFVTQLEALKKYRKSPSQTIRVEHVTVNAGGQAIVGDVRSGGIDVE
ncbi:hypothetical protein BCF46_2371 [Litoreibacter meonggei]|uniref:Uncharacterized protein n=1 Tax=Litoreibacter meonggei TaxID=1049199 RepID=A0A497WT27_9RHOB|nr:hypothetical protein [Litoreibacter meonggei]RLJ52143.1 hypothetical protein BCF46_2371 [Litoreibacter meonggei]